MLCHCYALLCACLLQQLTVSMSWKVPGVERWSTSNACAPLSTTVTAEKHSNLGQLLVKCSKGRHDAAGWRMLPHLLLTSTTTAVVQT